MDSVSIYMVKSPCSNTLPRSGKPLELVEAQINSFCLRATAEHFILKLILRLGCAPECREASRNGQPVLIWTVLFPRFFTPD